MRAHDHHLIDSFDHLQISQIHTKPILCCALSTVGILGWDRRPRGFVTADSISTIFHIYDAAHITHSLNFRLDKIEHKVDFFTNLILKFQWSVFILNVYLNNSVDSVPLTIKVASRKLKLRWKLTCFFGIRILNFSLQRDCRSSRCLNSISKGHIPINTNEVLHICISIE